MSFRTSTITTSRECYPLAASLCISADQRRSQPSSSSRFHLRQSPPFLVSLLHLSSINNHLPPSSSQRGLHFLLLPSAFGTDWCFHQKAPSSRTRPSSVSPTQPGNSPDPFPRSIICAFRPSYVPLLSLAVADWVFKQTPYSIRARLPSVSPSSGLILPTIRTSSMHHLFHAPSLPFFVFPFVISCQG